MSATQEKTVVLAYCKCGGVFEFEPERFLKDVICEKMFRNFIGPCPMCGGRANDIWKVKNVKVAEWRSR